MVSPRLAMLSLLLFAASAGCWFMYMSSRELAGATAQEFPTADARVALRGKAAASGGEDPLRLILFGPPAAGKGTQAEKLISRYHMLHVSTGDILRAEVRAGSPLGLKAKSYMDAGKLVPDEVVIALVAQKMGTRAAKRKGWLLDGFPRTGEQAGHLLRSGSSPSMVLVINVPDEEVLRRITSRRVDPLTKKAYRLGFLPQDPAILKRLVLRSDDNGASVRTRLKNYHGHVDTVKAAFAGKGTNVVEVDGVGTPAEVFARIAQMLPASPPPPR
jgi:adenylate kinase